MSLASSLTVSQREQLLALVAECWHLGATDAQLEPLLLVLTAQAPFDVSRDHFPVQPDDLPPFSD